MSIAHPDPGEAVDRAMDVVKACIGPHGFLASPIQNDNYRRIWARDGAIIGLAGLMTGDSEMATALRNTLDTLANNQGPHGEIPSNVDPVSGRVSYGGMTGRVDADLWFVIGYGYRFDAFANILASLLDISTETRRQTVDDFIENDIVPKEIKLLPAFSPVIKPIDKDWEDLQITFSYSFKNRPYEFHNGGLWPMITGFYVADLAGRGKKAQAAEYQAGIHKANALPMDGDPWSFPEYVNGREFRAEGNRLQCWRAAAAIM